ncbi:hypothetical protein [Adlercreutzia agrestimuris]|uniref:hypothetical protein n=1 Tax=Adlercreutzia agrestimuris TaxID=2941324 RepID=UPI00203BDB61|nr:hypothetical protein [Adlercreutzia agrestimuris]
MNSTTLSPTALAQNAAYTQEYLAYLSEDTHDEANRRLAWARMGEGTAFYQGKPNAISYVSRIFGEETRTFMSTLSQTAYHIMCKVIIAYQHDPKIRALFHFDKRVERLVQLPSCISEPLPLTRVDFMLDETNGAVHFCEFNTDSSSGMDETRNATSSLAPTTPYQEFCAQHPCKNDLAQLFDGWVDTFLDLLRKPSQEHTPSPANHSDEPSESTQPTHVGIIVCLEDAHPHIGELQTYAEVFEAHGVSCSVYDVRELEFDGKNLRGKHAYYGRDNTVIDAIWRFCIVVDLLKYWDQVSPLISAVECGAVRMIGAFSTQIVHDKQLFALLRHPLMQALFSPDEQRFIEEHIPETHFLDEAGLDLEEIAANPQKWVLKPTDWYASINVVAGPDCTPEAWAAHLESARSDPHTTYIVQRFYAPSQTPTIPLYGNEADFSAPPTTVGNLFGAYVYAGGFAGLYVRQGPHDVIGTAREGLVAPVLWVDE